MHLPVVRKIVLPLFLIIAFHSVPARAGEFRLSAEGMGPIVVSMTVNVRNGKEELTAFPRRVAELTARARNDSGMPIQRVRLCVQAERRTKGCDFQLWSNDVWQPGEELVWMVDKPAKRGIENARIMILTLQTPKLRQVAGLNRSNSRRENDGRSE